MKGGKKGEPVGCTHSNMCTTKLYTYHCGRGKRVKRPCEHSISILPGTIRVNHYSSLAPLPLTHTSAKDYGWKSSMSSSRITRKREQTPFLCRRESPRHEKKLSGGSKKRLIGQPGKITIRASLPRANPDVAVFPPLSAPGHYYLLLLRLLLLVWVSVWVFVIIIYCY